MTTNFTNDPARIPSPWWPSTGPYNPQPWPWPWPGPTPMPMPMPMPGPSLPPTRGVTPLSPEYFAPVEPRPIAAPAGPAPISPAEREVLRRTLAIVKDSRGSQDPLARHRTLAAIAYLAGFLEARGHAQLGAFVATIPPDEGQAAAQLEQFLAQVDQAIGDPETRMGPAAVVGWIAIGAAGNAAWEGVKWVYNKLK